MKGQRGFFDIIFFGFVVAGILVLTRPGSQGVALFRGIAGGFTNFAQAVSGQKVTKF